MSIFAKLFICAVIGNLLGVASFLTALTAAYLLSILSVDSARSAFTQQVFSTATTLNIVYPTIIVTLYLVPGALGISLAVCKFVKDSKHKIPQHFFPYTFGWALGITFASVLLPSVIKHFWLYNFGLFSSILILPPYISSLLAKQKLNL